MSTNQTPAGLPDAPQIENIEILELLGTGGMSQVYKGRQTKLDRFVAVKVLTPSSLQDEEGIRRFQKEAKLTSALEHPNVVKTISFGVSGQGQPYLVMEYLQGLSLADELKQHGRLKLQKFSDVFLPVLSALDKAHKAGLVHRDIKPANIMICHSGTGSDTVKLVDFGIAKVFGGGGETHNLTKSGSVLGTPTYMSPEQCEGKPLDGRSDLYSMACVMYETLSGEPPFTGDSLFEVMQKHSAEAPPTVSDLSGKIDIKKELAKVTLWGLAKDPAARPQTASEFAKKLREVLERITLDKVPRIKKASILSSGKTGKATHKTVTIFVAIALLLALLCSIYFLIIAPSKTQESKKQNQQDALLYYKNQTEKQKPEREYVRRLESKEKRYGRNHPEVATALIDLGHSYFEQGRKAAAEPLFKRALAISEKNPTANDLNIATAAYALAYCYKEDNRIAESEPLFRRSLEIRKKVLGPDSEEVKTTQTLLNSVKFQLINSKTIESNDYSQKEITYKQALENSENTYGPDAIEVVKTLTDLIGLYEIQGRWKEEEPLLKQALLIREKALGSKSPDVAQNLLQLGTCYIQERKYRQAEQLLKRSTNVFEELADSTTKVMYHNALGFCYLNQNKNKAAELELNCALLIGEKVFQENDPTMLTTYDYLADTYIEQKKYLNAEPIIRRNLEIRDKALYPNCPDSFRIQHAHELYRLGTCRLGLGKYLEATKYLEKSLAVFQRWLKPGDPLIAMNLKKLAECHKGFGTSSQSST